MDENKAKIIAFLSKFFHNPDLQDDANIFLLGFVNSLLAIQLVTFIEGEFDIMIENEDLDLENFSSINSIAGLIERKTPSRPGIQTQGSTK